MPSSVLELPMNQNGEFVLAEHSELGVAQMLATVRSAEGSQLVLIQSGGGTLQLVDAKEFTVTAGVDASLPDIKLPLHRRAIEHVPIVLGTRLDCVVRSFSSGTTQTFLQDLGGATYQVDLYNLVQSLVVNNDHNSSLVAVPAKDSENCSCLIWITEREKQEILQKLVVSIIEQTEDARLPHAELGRFLLLRLLANTAIADLQAILQANPQLGSTNTLQGIFDGFNKYTSVSSSIGGKVRIKMIRSIIGKDGLPTEAETKLLLTKCLSDMNAPSYSVLRLALRLLLQTYSFQDITEVATVLAQTFAEGNRLPPLQNLVTVPTMDRYHEDTEQEDREELPAELINSELSLELERAITEFEQKADVIRNGKVDFQRDAITVAVASVEMVADKIQISLKHFPPEQQDALKKYWNNRLNAILQSLQTLSSELIAGARDALSSADQAAHLKYERLVHLFLNDTAQIRDSRFRQKLTRTTEPSDGAVQAILKEFLENMSSLIIYSQQLHRQKYKIESELPQLVAQLKESATWKSLAEPQISLLTSDSYRVSTFLYLALSKFVSQRAMNKLKLLGEYLSNLPIGHQMASAKLKLFAMRCTDVIERDKEIKKKFILESTKFANTLMVTNVPIDSLQRILQESKKITAQQPISSQGDQTHAAGSTLQLKWYFLENPGTRNVPLPLRLYDERAPSAKDHVWLIARAHEIGQFGFKPYTKGTHTEAVDGLVAHAYIPSSELVKYVIHDNSTDADEFVQQKGLVLVDDSAPYRSLFPHPITIDRQIPSADANERVVLVVDENEDFWFKPL